jgi:ATP-dependent RNA helicase DHX57
LLSCVDPILTICAGLTLQTPFLSPQGAQQEATAAQLRFGTAKSDHLSLLKVYREFVKAKHEHRAREFCSEHFLSYITLDTITKVRKQFSEILEEFGFIQRSLADNSGSSLLGGPSANSHSDKVKVLQGCLCAGFYSNVVKIQPPPSTFVKIAEGGAVESTADRRKFKFFTKNQQIFLHPASINFPQQSFESVWLVYLSLVQTSKLYLRDSTMVFPIPMLLFGGNLRVDHTKGYLIVGSPGIIFRKSLSHC